MIINGSKYFKALLKIFSKFQFVMRNLVKRYIAQLQRCKQQNEGITEDDVAEIKQVLLLQMIYLILNLSVSM